MRREGFELQVSKPQVIIREIDGVQCEPFERVQCEVPQEYTGAVIESLGQRKGEMLDMVTTDNGLTRIIFMVPPWINWLYNRVHVTNTWIWYY